MTAQHTCPNCGAAVPLPLLLCPACRAAGWSDGPYHLTGDELARYLELRRGERQKAPHGWWSGEEGLQRGTALLRWHLQREQGAQTREAVLARASLRTLVQARLSRCFSNRERTLSVFNTFQLVFPELALHPWELPDQVPRGYWEAGGDAARAEALHWWLERLGLSAHQVLAQLETRAHSIERQLREAGLGDLTHGRSLRALLNLIEPSISPEPPPSARGQRREEATLACPCCQRRLRSLAQHLAQAHPELSAEERRALLNSHDRLSPATLARYAAARRAPLDDEARWRACGPAFPTTWWPTEVPGVALALLEQSGGPVLQLAPAAQHPRRLHRNGRSWELRIPPRVRAAIAGAPVARAECGVRIGPLGEEGAATVRRWLDGSAAEREEEQ